MPISMVKTTRIRSCLVALAVLCRVTISTKGKKFPSTSIIRSGFRWHFILELEFKMGENWGSYGSWRDCPAHEYVTAFDIKLHGRQSGYWDDDLGMTGMKIRCEGGSTLTSRSANKGTYGALTEECGSGFTKAKVRIQSHQVAKTRPKKIKKMDVSLAWANFQFRQAKNDLIS